MRFTVRTAQLPSCPAAQLPSFPHPHPNPPPPPPDQVWMRTAGLPSFRKLYAKIDETLPKGEYEVEVYNGRLHPSGAQGPSAAGQTLWNYGTGAQQTSLFPVHGFGGGKTVVLSTMSFMGGKNPFLGVAYVVVGAVCLALALLFFIKVSRQ